LDTGELDEQNHTNWKIAPPPGEAIAGHHFRGKNMIRGENENGKGRKRKGKG
jgi:hypothetical protein